MSGRSPRRRSGSAAPPRLCSPRERAGSLALAVRAVGHAPRHVDRSHVLLPAIARAAPGARLICSTFSPSAARSAWASSTWLFGLPRSTSSGRPCRPTHSPIRNGSCPSRWSSSRRSSSAAHTSAAARWNCCGGEQPQRVAHEDGDTAAAVRASIRCPDDALQPADREGVGGKPEVGLGLTATGREEQQVDGRAVAAAGGMSDVDQRGQVGG